MYNIQNDFLFEWKFKNKIFACFGIFNAIFKSFIKSNQNEFGLS